MLSVTVRITEGIAGTGELAAEANIWQVVSSVLHINSK